MVKRQYGLVVDNSTSTNSAGSKVQLNFQPNIDLDLDKDYSLTITEVDVTYINPNMVNGQVGFSYVYTAPSNLTTLSPSPVPQGYVMRTIYNGSQSSYNSSSPTSNYGMLHEIMFFNGSLSTNITRAIDSTTPINTGTGSISGSTVSGSTSGLNDGNPSTFVTVNKSSGNAGVSLNYSIGFPTTSSFTLVGAPVIEAIPDAGTGGTYPKTFPMTVYYNVSTTCQISVYYTDSTYNISTGTLISSGTLSPSGSFYLLPSFTVAGGTTYYMAINIQSSVTNFTLYDLILQPYPLLMYNTIQNIAYVSTGDQLTAVATFNSAQTNYAPMSSAYYYLLTDGFSDTMLQLYTTNATANVLTVTINYTLTFIGNSQGTINYINYYMDTIIPSTGIAQFYLTDSNFANPIYLNSSNNTISGGLNGYTVNFPTPKSIGSKTQQGYLYLQVQLSFSGFVSGHMWNILDAFFCLVQDNNIGTQWYDTAVRTNASGKVVDPWNVSNPIIPIADTAGLPVVNAVTTGRLTTVAQGFPTGLYDLDDLYLELLNILERDPAYTYNSSNTASNSATYPPFKLIGDASTEQVQIQIFDPNLYIELPIIGKYAQSNVLYWLGFDPVVYQDISYTPSLFISSSAPLPNYLTVWTSSPYYYNTSGIKVFPPSVQKMANSYPIPVYSNSSARLNQLTSYYLNTDIAAGTYVNGQAQSVIATMTPVNTQVGMIYSYRPIIPLQVRITKFLIDQALFWMTDQNGNLADFSNGGQNDSPESWSFRAFIEELD